MRDPKKFRNDRPVDRYRNGGGRGQVEGDVGPILSMFSIRDERMYIVAERGIASAQMADQIDPERINPRLPLMIQRPELNYGAATPFVQRTVCVGAALFDQTYLPAEISKDTALSLALEAAEAMAEVQDNITALAASEAEVRRKIDAKELKAHALPKTANLRGRVNGSIAGLRSIVVAAQQLADLFYPRAKANDPFTDTLRAALQAQLANDDIGWPTLDWCFDELERHSNYRNAMIHGGPGKEKHLIIRDYEIEADGVMIAPTIEVIHPDTPLPRIDVVRLLNDSLEAMSQVFEAYAVIFCDRNAGDRLPGMRTSVVADERDLRTGTRFRWHSEWLEGFPKMGPQPEFEQAD